MKEAYEALEMEIIAFEGDIITDDNGIPTDIINASSKSSPYQQPQ